MSYHFVDMWLGLVGDDHILIGSASAIGFCVLTSLYMTNTSTRAHTLVDSPIWGLAIVGLSPCAKLFCIFDAPHYSDNVDANKTYGKNFGFLFFYFLSHNRGFMI